MNPKISVIIPTYNRAHLVGRAIQSVLNQTYQVFELIIVDDGSTDNTEEVVEEIQKKDKRIKYIRLDKNSGAPAHPKNVGIQNAKGDYIAFLDSDDEWLPEKLEKQIQLFKNSKKKNLGFIGCNKLIIDERENKRYEYKTPKYKNVYQKLLENNFICSSSSVVVKKSVIDNVGLFDENLKFADDWDMWIRIAQKYDFDFVPESLFKYYIHKNNITKTLNWTEKERDFKYIFEKYKRYYEQNPKIYSILLRTLGAINIQAGKIKIGKGYFLKSIQMNPLNCKSYIYFFIYGSRFYGLLSSMKAKIKEWFK